MNKRPRLLVLCAFDQGSTFSYHTAWPRHFERYPGFATTIINLRDQSMTARAKAMLTVTAGNFDVIVLLHSVFSNAQLLDGILLEMVQRSSRPKVFFIGNEYKLMPEKMAFAEALPVTLLVSQSSSEDVQRLYRERLHCAVVGIPNTGLDAELFVARTPSGQRPIDLGYRADDAPSYIGHTERRDIAEFFLAAADRYGLRVDISMDPKSRLPEGEWAAFLDRCKGQLGAEAGGDYFELDDRTRDAVLAYEAEHPGATFDEIHENFFANYPNRVPIRIMSGRQVEAAGTRTAQVLFEGRYDDYFLPDVHYIPLRKDFSNADDAIRKFKDVSFRNELTERAYTMAIEQLAYDALIGRFAAALSSVA
ncbi:MAG: hypothetical protein K2Y23_04710 [Cyanobacteria bacterium]|nr:hypothetical protein [Cyanobacteriota bacterium]